MSFLLAVNILSDIYSFTINLQQISAFIFELVSYIKLESIETISMAWLTLLIPIALGIWADIVDKKKFLDNRIVLGQVVRVPRFVIATILLFVPSLLGVYIYTVIGWFIGNYFYCKLLGRLYKWVLGGEKRENMRRKYLKRSADLSVIDFKEIWKSVWTSRIETYDEMQEYLDIFWSLKNKINKYL